MPSAPVVPRLVRTWRIAGRVIVIDRPIILGVLNVTPDSFSDGGRYATVDAAVARAQAMVAEGADIIDVGGESTRPQGARPVDVAEELRRVLPVVRSLRRSLPEETPISVDTVKAEVAAAALDEGAQIVNDVSGLRLSRGMAELCAAKGAGVVLMHSRGEVADMATYGRASYDDVVDDVFAELRARLDAAQSAGVVDECIAVDPGLGFSKRSEHSLALLAALPQLATWGYPVLVGASRKRFVGEITGVAEPTERVHGTTGANVAALERGARLFRVHDVRAARQALDVAWAVREAERRE